MLRAVIAAVVLAGAGAGPALALTAEDIERGSKRAMAGLRPVTTRLAADDLDGRDNDTPGSKKARDYLVRRLAGIGEGIDPSRTGPASHEQPFEISGKRGTNLFAVIRGRELPGEYVVVGAHYDHLGRCDSSPGGTVCNGATDNATGVAAVLAIGEALRRLPEPPRRSVVLALWDAEEDGLLGSLYYVGNPLVPLADTTAYVNFDILGSDLLPSLREVSFAVGAETGGPALQGLVTDAARREGFGTTLVSYVFGQLRSDYANFVAKSIPTVFFSDSTGACYHTTGDDVRLVDFRKVREQSQIGFRVTAWLAENPERLPFVAPAALGASHDDAVAIAGVVRTGLVDLLRFPPAARKELLAVDARLQAIASAPASEFDAADAGAVIEAALSTISLLTDLECPGVSRPRRPLPGLAAAGPR